MTADEFNALLAQLGWSISFLAYSKRHASQHDANQSKRSISRVVKASASVLSIPEDQRTRIFNGRSVLVLRG